MLHPSYIRPPAPTPPPAVGNRKGVHECGLYPLRSDVRDNHGANLHHAESSEEEEEEEEERREAHKPKSRTQRPLHGFRHEAKDEPPRSPQNSFEVPPKGSQRIWDNLKKKWYDFPSGFFLDVETGKLCHRPKLSAPPDPLRHSERQQASSRPKEASGRTTEDRSNLRDYYNPRRSEKPASTNLPRHDHLTAGGGANMGRERYEYRYEGTVQAEGFDPDCFDCQEAQARANEASGRTKRRDSVYETGEAGAGDYYTVRQGDSGNPRKSRYSTRGY